MEVQVPAAEGGSDAIDLGFAPIHAVLRNDLRTSEAMTSIYVAAAALEARNPAQQVAIRQRLNAEGVIGTGEFAAGETAVAGDPAAEPAYRQANLATTVRVRSIDSFANPGDTQYQSYNRYGGRRYLKIDLPAETGLRIEAQGTAGRDPDFVLYRRGVDQCPSFSSTCDGTDNSVADGLEVATYSNLPAGTYVLDVADCSNLGTICRDSPAPGNAPITVTVRPNWAVPCFCSCHLSR